MACVVQRSTHLGFVLGFHKTLLWGFGCNWPRMLKCSFSMTDWRAASQHKRLVRNPGYCSWPNLQLRAFMEWLPLSCSGHQQEVVVGLHSDMPFSSLCIQTTPAGYHMSSDFLVLNCWAWGHLTEVCRQAPPSVCGVGDSEYSLQGGYLHLSFPRCKQRSQATFRRGIGACLRITQSWKGTVASVSSLTTKKIYLFIIIFFLGTQMIIKNLRSKCSSVNFQWSEFSILNILRVKKRKKI